MKLIIVKIFVKILILISLIIFSLSVILYYKQHTSEELYQCKVLETFRGLYGVSNAKERFIADVYIIKLNKAASIHLDLNGYYLATKSKETNKTVEYYFNKKEILEITNQTNYPFILLISSILLFLLAFIIGVICAEKW